MILKGNTYATIQNRLRPEYELTSLFDLGRVLYIPYDEIIQRYSEPPKDVILVTHSPVADNYGTMKLHLDEGKIVPTH